jgi:hypothetical protein
MSTGDVYTGTFCDGIFVKGAHTRKDGSCVYDGEYNPETQKYEGKGTLYGERWYTIGSFKDGMMNGQCKKYCKSTDRLIFDGFIEDDLYKFGTFYHPDGRYFKGIFMTANRAMGTLFSEDGLKLYTGNFYNLDYHGYGTLYDSDGNETYSGHFLNGERSLRSRKTLRTRRRPLFR